MWLKAAKLQNKIFDLETTGRFSWINATFEPVVYYVDKQILKTNKDITDNIKNLETFFDYEFDLDINAVKDVLNDGDLFEQIVEFADTGNSDKIKSIDLLDEIPSGYRQIKLKEMLINSLTE